MEKFTLVRAQIWVGVARLVTFVTLFHGCIGNRESEGCLNNMYLAVHTVTTGPFSAPLFPSAIGRDHKGYKAILVLFETMKVVAKSGSVIL